MAPASRLPVGAGSRVGRGHVFRAELECFTPRRRNVRRRLPGDGRPPFGWFPCGELNAAHNCIDHHFPMVPELPGTMLACARIGAVHNIVFAGFPPDALASRMERANSTVLVTCEGHYRQGSAVDPKRTPAFVTVSPTGPPTNNGLHWRRPTAAGTTRGRENPPPGNSPRPWTSPRQCCTTISGSPSRRC